MNKLKAIIAEKTTSARETLKTSMVFTFLWGLAAHGYMLLSNSISHDSLDEFLAVDAIVRKKVAAGRIFVHVVNFARGGGIRTLVAGSDWAILCGVDCISDHPNF